MFKLAFKTATTVYSTDSPEIEGAARTLREIAALLDKRMTHGAIRDINGDIIGSWTFRV